MTQIPRDHLAEALESLDAAGLEYTVLCAGPEVLCPGWDWAIAA